MATEKLIAIRRITYGNQQYFPGDELPKDSPLVSEWVDGEVAKWQTDESLVAPKARPVTAQAGLEGVNVVNGEIDETLIGRIPKIEARKRAVMKKSPRKRIAGE